MSETETIEEFAALLAELANPFALRRAVLADRGLSEEQFVALNARWTRELAAGEARGLAERFRAAYATMTSALRSAQYAASASPP